jgi:dethiobiotin synthetase
MLKGLFITGSDTGVGKTRVGYELVAQLYQHGISVIPKKPVESGCEPHDGALRAADAQRYLQAVDFSIPPDMVCRYRFTAALAPPVAARLEGVTLTMDALIVASRAATDGKLTIVEGAGGFYSPLAEDGLNANLAERLGFPVLLVAANRLGCINHVLLTLEAIASHGLETLAIILNETDPEASLPENLEMLRALQPLPVIPLGFNEHIDAAEMLSLAGHPLKSLDHGIR